MMCIVIRMFTIFLLLVVATSAQDKFDLPHPHVRPPCRSRSKCHRVDLELSCPSWQFGVETNSLEWETIPEECVGYVGQYMYGNRYREDSQMVTNEAFLYANSLSLSRDANNVWVFDVDDTTLSNLPYYARYGFGVEQYNATSFDEWVIKWKAPALAESHKLYKRLLCLRIKIIFLTERREDQRSFTERNLKCAGFHTWEKVVFKGPSFSGKTVVEYKSAERKNLEDAGYRIVGNIGDQWSDLLGTYKPCYRNFKLPNPMYYVH